LSIDVNELTDRTENTLKFVGGGVPSSA